MYNSMGRDALNTSIGTHSLVVVTRNESNDGKGARAIGNERKVIMDTMGGGQTASVRYRDHISSVSLNWVVIELGLRVSVTARVLQLEVSAVFLGLPSQTKLSVHLLFPSSFAPLAAFPNSEPNEYKEEDEAPEEDVGPPTQDLCLEFFLLPAIGDGRFLALVGRNIDDAHPRLNESDVSLLLIGYQHDLSENIMVECATFDTAKERQAM